MRNQPIHTSDVLGAYIIHYEIPRYAQSVTGALWRMDRDKVNRGQVLKIIESDIHKQLTVRNPNTVRKLYALMRADTISP